MQTHLNSFNMATLPQSSCDGAWEHPLRHRISKSKPMWHRNEGLDSFLSFLFVDIAVDKNLIILTNFAKLISDMTYESNIIYKHITRCCAFVLKESLCVIIRAFFIYLVNTQ